jgi:hypothetical protein
MMATAKGIKAGDKPLHFNLEVLGYMGTPWVTPARTLNPPIAVRVTGRGLRGQLSGLALVHDITYGVKANWMMHGNDPLAVELKGDGRYSFMMGSGSLHRLTEAGVQGLDSAAVRNSAEQWATAHPLGLREHLLAVACGVLNDAERATARARENLKRAEEREAEADAALAQAKQDLAVAQAKIDTKG